MAMVGGWGLHTEHCWEEMGLAPPQCLVVRIPQGQVGQTKGQPQILMHKAEGAKILEWVCAEEARVWAFLFLLKYDVSPQTRPYTAGGKGIQGHLFESWRVDDGEWIRRKRRISGKFTEVGDCAAVK